MKVRNIIANCGMVIATGLVASSCVKHLGKEVAFEETGMNNRSFVQVYNGTLSSNRNYVYVDAKPVNGATLAYAGTFPATPANFSIISGYREFMIRDTLTATTQNTMTFAENFQPTSYYTIFMYDTVNAAKVKTVLNNIIVPTDTTARLRFANFIYNPGSLTAFDIYSKRRGANIFTNVQVSDVTEFIPYATALPDTFLIRPTGTTADLQNFVPATAPATGGTFVNVQAILTPSLHRSYTLVFRGGFRSAVSTITTLRTLSVFANN
jgi:hypothetical protein